MLNWISGICIGLVALIHLAPAIGVAGAEKLATLYGREFSEANLQVLMRHRAVLFGIVGGLMLYAAFDPALRGLAYLVGFVSVVSFLMLVKTTQGLNAEVMRVYAVDWVALGLLVIGVVAHFKN